MEKIIKMNSDFLEGIKAFFQPVNVYENRVESILQVSDTDALKSDWQETGKDVSEAMLNYEKSYDRR